MPRHRRTTRWSVLLLAAAAWAPARGAEPRPSAILISVDDLRADALSPDRTPTLARLAAEGIVFDKAFSAATWTLPSHASMLSGLLPRAHLAGGSTLKPRAVKPGVSLLSDWFRAAGYRTAAFYNGDFLNPVFGFGSGFDTYQRSYVITTFADAAGWALRHADKPFFLFIHTYDVHRYPRLVGRAGTAACPATADLSRPYPSGGEAPDEAACARARDAYALAARCFDVELSGFLSQLERAGLLDKIALAVTSDHGEALCERHDGRRSLGHGLLPFDEEIHVPWILRLPGKKLAGARVRDLVSSVDVAATLAAAAGLVAPAGLDGVSRLPGASTGPRAALIESDEWAALRGETLETVVFRDGRRAVYDLIADPEEKNAAEAAPSEESERLARRIRRPLPEGKPVELDDRLREGLKAAGYLR